MIATAAFCLGSACLKGAIATRNLSARIYLTAPLGVRADLHRTAARNMIRAGVPQTVAMSISGHRTISAFKRCKITSDDDKREALQWTEAHLGAIRSKENVTAIFEHGQKARTFRLPGTDEVRGCAFEVPLARGISGAPRRTRTPSLLICSPGGYRGEKSAPGGNGLWRWSRPGLRDALFAGCVAAVRRASCPLRFHAAHQRAENVDAASQEFVAGPGYLFAWRAARLKTKYDAVHKCPSKIASAKTRIGGLSKTTSSKTSTAKARKRFIASDERRPDGSGACGPAGSTEMLGTSVRRIASPRRGPSWRPRPIRGRRGWRH